MNAKRNGDYAMKKLVYLFCFMLLGIQCQAIEIFPLSNIETSHINGTVQTKGNRDIVILNVDSQTDNLSDILTNTLNQRTLINATNNVLASATTRRIATARDPYLVKIDGVNYIMIKDNPTKNWSKKDILGIDDTKETIFRALKSIESDGDRTKLTPQELKRANIRFAKVDNNGVVLANDKTQDFDLDKISYIDMINLRNIANGNITGVFGHFNLYLKTNNNSKKMVIGYVTLHNNDSTKISFK